MKSLDDVGGRHPEFRDRKPDLPPLPPPEPEPPPGPSRVPFPRLMAWFFVFLGLVAFVLSVSFAMRLARYRAEEQMLEMLNFAVKQYQVDYGVLPPGDGLGSAGLARALNSPGPRGAPYLDPGEGWTDAAGNLLIRGGALVRYRAPGIFGEFELWADPPPR
jgi:hypothetical protein